MAKNKRSKGSLSWLWMILAVFLALFLYANPELEEILTSPPTEYPTVLVQNPPTLPQDNYFQLFFTDPPSDPEVAGIEANLIELLNSAETGIDGAFYELDLSQLAQALINAQTRGVLVRLVYDNAEASDHPERLEIIKALQSAGIVLVPDKRSALMHNKFFVIDKKILWTGSFNFTENASHKNNENAVIFNIPQLVANYQKEFEEMFVGQQFGITSPADTPYPEIDWNGIHISNYFAPEDDVMPKVIATVKEAKYSLDFLTFSFTDVNLGYTMSELALNEDLIVRGVFESSQDMGDSVCPYLMERAKNIEGNGQILPKLDGNPNTMHQKVIVIDDEIVVFGSFNFSQNATKNNDENLLIIRDPALATLFKAEFEKIFAQANDPTNNCKKK